MVIWLAKGTHGRRAWPYYPVTENRIYAHKKLRFRFSSVLVENRGFGFGLKTVNSPTRVYMRKVMQAYASVQTSANSIEIDH